jgi:heme oxygenase
LLEGSTNGGRFLARVLRTAWQLDGRGLDALDPYGEDQPARWAEFKRDMDALQLPPEDADGVVAAAVATFTAIAEISDRVAGIRDWQGHRA